MMQRLDSIHGIIDPGGTNGRHCTYYRYGQGTWKGILNTFLVHGYCVFAGRYRDNTKNNDSRSIGADSLVIVPLDDANPESVEAARLTECE